MSEIWRCLGESRPEVWGCPGNVCLGRVWRIPKAGRGLQGWVECGMHSRGAGVGSMCVQRLSSRIGAGGSVGGCGASPSVVSVGTQCGSPILGIRRGVGECRVLGPGPPTASGMGGLTPCSKNQRAGGDAYEKVQFTKGTLLKGERAAVPSPLPRPNSLLLPSELSLGFWLG